MLPLDHGADPGLVPVGYQVRPSGVPVAVFLDKGADDVDGFPGTAGFLRNGGPYLVYNGSGGFVFPGFALVGSNPDTIFVDETVPGLLAREFEP